MIQLNTYQKPCPVISSQIQHIISKLRQDFVFVWFTILSAKKKHVCIGKGKQAYIHMKMLMYVYKKSTIFCASNSICKTSQEMMSWSRPKSLAHTHTHIPNVHTYHEYCRPFYLCSELSLYCVFRSLAHRFAECHLFIYSLLYGNSSTYCSLNTDFSHSKGETHELIFTHY